jgi:ankyrin repeat protein
MEQSWNLAQLTMSTHLPQQVYVGAFIEFARDGELFIVERYLDFDIVSVNQTGSGDYEGLTALMQAAINGQDLVCAMLVRRGADTNVFNHVGMSPLHNAVMGGHLLCAIRIINGGANVDLSCEKSGLTPLHAAASQNQVRAASLLVKNGALVDLKDKVGMTALDHARYYGHTEMTNFLTAQNALSTGNLPVLKKEDEVIFV